MNSSRRIWNSIRFRPANLHETLKCAALLQEACLIRQLQQNNLKITTRSWRSSKKRKCSK